MLRNWTFGARIAGGFAVMVVFVVLLGAIAVVALQNVVDSKDKVIRADAPFLLAATQMQTRREAMSGDIRSYLLNGTEKALNDFQVSREQFFEILNRIRNGEQGDRGKEILAAIDDAAESHRQAIDRMIASRRAGVELSAILAAAQKEVSPYQIALDDNIVKFIDYRQEQLEVARQLSSDFASRMTVLIVAVALLAAVISAVLAYALARTLSKQVGVSVNHVRSASSELHAAANQQATGVKEQVTSMNEINTTISELLATSLQIAESAQRVTEIADKTATAARAGDGTVTRASDSIDGIRRQFDLVVGHMLDLGKRSQQIGAVMDLVRELAEQTNILSINATIEAAGAGEAGRRFGTVADEIRKLADRVTDSAKEIRAMIEDMRSAVSTTVMATETGSKTVDAGTRQFGEVTTLFRQIAELVNTTNEAAREIELSTKQQATAVEQVNMAIINVSQAAKETEASAGQTIQTASELAATSHNLLRLVHMRAAG